MKQTFLATTAAIALLSVSAVSAQQLSGEDAQRKAIVPPPAATAAGSSVVGNMPNEAEARQSEEELQSEAEVRQPAGPGVDESTAALPAEEGQSPDQEELAREGETPTSSDEPIVNN